MPKPSDRTRSKRRINKTAPGGKRTTDLKEKTSSGGHCSRCGKVLTGVSNLSFSRTRKLNRGKRRTWRMNGGQLCHSCLKLSLKQKIREQQ